jgi:hypothetical protein
MQSQNPCPVSPYDRGVIYGRPLARTASTTLSPVATCGDNRFKFCDKQLFRNEFILINAQYFTQLATRMATSNGCCHINRHNVAKGIYLVGHR